MKTILLSASIYGLMAAVCMRPEDGAGSSGQGGAPAPSDPPANLNPSDGSHLREYKGTQDPSHAATGGEAEYTPAHEIEPPAKVVEFHVENGQVVNVHGVLADGRWRHDPA
jgi:hypothetical protein